MTMEQARGRTGTGNGGKTGRKTVRGKDPEAVAREQFEAWMQRIMERFDRQDRIISVLINKDAAGVKYMDGERLYDNQDLCEMLRTSKRSLQRFRSEYGLRYRKISRKSYYKESDVLEFISRNMEEVVQDGEKVLKMKDRQRGNRTRRKEKAAGNVWRYTAESISQRRKEEKGLYG